MNATIIENKLEAEMELETNEEQSPKIEISWIIVAILGFNHVAAIYGLYLVFTSAKIATTLFAIFLYQFTMLGTTAGVHRLWAHRTYKAKWPLQVLLMIMFSTSYQFSVLTWSRDHRVHHKFTDTNADPYSSKRGFLFSHMGWVFLKKHPDVAKKGKEIDVSDLYNNPLVRFQHEHKTAVLMLCCYVLPTLIPMYFWNETLANSFYVAVALRWTFTAHLVGLVNSVAHMFGNKPYDKNLTAVENMSAAILTSGEGWHNYHHAFPWDYSASELGNHWTNNTTRFIDFFARIGWAYDLKTVSPDLVRKRTLRTGDGSHPVWGWNDKDLTEEDRLGATILSPQSGTKIFK
ncbi:acyl-CoA Delta-9 desaturase-like [Phymastichus coffea]|uniref:acyl-CoA Delta-9 desaturase-like n=1 Tax=Phymastichus coffea TaxID=108790 RepID=UPI00273C9DCA|nr:acyl-CoA Delta-9 desaturase-like [Phymastichus coffea]